MLICIGVDSVFAIFDFTLQFLQDLFPKLKEKVRRELICLIVCVVSFLFSCIFCTQGGLYIFDLFDSQASNITLLLCVLGELIFIPWSFGLDRLDILIQNTTGETIPAFAKFAIRYIVPSFIFILFILNVITEFSEATAKQRNWPGYVTWLSRLLWIIPLFSLFKGFGYELEVDTIETIIKKQHGITFNADGTYTKAEPTDPKKAEIETPNVV